MKHVPHECKGCVDESCPVCVGLNGCSVCNTWECEVPKDCPGYRLKDSFKEAICRGDINFIDGKWTGLKEA